MTPPILTPEEAVVAAVGGWPSSFDGFIAGMTALEIADAKIEWADTANVHYAHQMLQGVALYYAGGNQAAATALLDAIFGI